MPMANKAND